MKYRNFCKSKNQSYKNNILVYKLDMFENYIKIFTLHDKNKIEDLIAQHKENPGLRLLQNELGKYITFMIHGEEQYLMAKEASVGIFGFSLMIRKEMSFIESMIALNSESFLITIALSFGLL